MSKVYLRILIVIVIIILGIVVWNIYYNYDQSASIEEKVVAEISYLDENITKIINFINNITINMYNVNEQEMSENQQSGDSSSGGAQGDSSGQSAGGSSSGDSQSGSSGQGSGGGSSQDSNQKETENNTQTTLMQYQIEKNNILNSEREANWKQIKNNIETLYTALTTIKVDLIELGIEESKIQKFSSLLDEAIIKIREENKDESIKILADIYKYLYEFYPRYDEKKYAYQTKADIIDAYALVQTSSWDEISEKIRTAQEKFKKVEEKSNKTITINKVNLLLKEIKECINLKDNDVFYIKYKNILDELENLC